MLERNAGPSIPVDSIACIVVERDFFILSTKILCPSANLIDVSGEEGFVYLWQFESEALPLFVDLNTVSAVCFHRSVVRM
ncbi:hypothetical protein SUGI_0500560 [Cryptomeria japonica]|nr:hypothetical protein SUGI_0500560 [Cryptomeria japonica]